MKLRVPGDEAQEILGELEGWVCDIYLRIWIKWTYRLKEKIEKERADAAEQQRNIAEQQRDIKRY